MKTLIRSHEFSAANPPPPPHGFQITPSESQVIIHGLPGLASHLHVACYALRLHLIHFLFIPSSAATLAPFRSSEAPPGCSCPTALPWLLPLLECSSSEVCMAHCLTLLLSFLKSSQRGLSQPLYPKPQTLPPYLLFLFMLCFPLSTYQYITSFIFVLIFVIIACLLYWNVSSMRPGIITFMFAAVSPCAKAMPPM